MTLAYAVSKSICSTRALLNIAERSWVSG